MKTYVIILSKTFPKSHPLSGQETGFGSSFKSGQKIHTVRGNYPMWKKRFEEVQERDCCFVCQRMDGHAVQKPSEGTSEADIRRPYRRSEGRIYEKPMGR